MEKGYIQVYTGNGKGKSTAAFGLALRAAMSGKSVYVGQFVKDMKYNETQITTLVPNIQIEQLGKGCFVFKSPEESDVIAAGEALEKCAEIMKLGNFDVVVLDEIFIALHYQLIRTQDVICALLGRASHVEVILTGRYAPEEIIEIADLVTEMKEVKHYYHAGVLSRDGIDH